MEPPAGFSCPFRSELATEAVLHPDVPVSQEMLDIRLGQHGSTHRPAFLTPPEAPRKPRCLAGSVRRRRDKRQRASDAVRRLDYDGAMANLPERLWRVPVYLPYPVSYTHLT